MFSEKNYDKAMASVEKIKNTKDNSILAYENETKKYASLLFDDITNTILSDFDDNMDIYENVLYKLIHQLNNEYKAAIKAANK